MKIKEVLIFLNLLEGLGPRRIGQIYQEMKKRGVEDITLQEVIDELSPFIPASLRKNLFDKDIQRLYEKELKDAEKNNIKILTWEDEVYPQRLRQIFDSPPVLYIRGDLEEGFSLAVVGSRRASFYGLQQAYNLSFKLAQMGTVIISGLARGIDTQAHKGALDASGKTLAVLGSGLLNIYPQENRRLAQRIAQQGCVFSEFPLRTPPLSVNFPRRNRILSGLSWGVIVVEAAKKSGALITADFALEQGREVFSLPGRVDSPTSQGTLNLIKQGAKLVSTVEDILEEFSDIVESKRGGEISSALELNDEESRVYELLDEPLHIDQIYQRTGMELVSVMKVVFNLRLKNLIEELPGQRYVCKKKIF